MVILEEDFFDFFIKIDQDVYFFSIHDTIPILKPLEFSIETFSKIFDFKYFDSQVEIWFSDKFTELDYGFFTFILIGKIYTLMKKRFFYFIAEKYEDFLSDDILESLFFHFDKDLFYNLIFEISLGSFNIKLPWFEEVEILNEFEKFLKKIDRFYTHVVGHQYYKYLHEEPFKENQQIFLYWEDLNEYDENAVVIVDENTKRIGYLRRTIAPFLTEILKTKIILNGKILKYVNQNNIFIEIELT